MMGLFSKDGIGLRDLLALRRLKLEGFNWLSSLFLF